MTEEKFRTLKVIPQGDKSRIEIVSQSDYRTRICNIEDIYQYHSRDAGKISREFGITIGQAYMIVSKFKESKPINPSYIIKELLSPVIKDTLREWEYGKIKAQGHKMSDIFTVLEYYTMTKQELEGVKEVFYTGFQSYGNPMRTQIHSTLMKTKHYKKGYLMAEKKKGKIDKCWKEYKNSINN